MNYSLILPTNFKKVPLPGLTPWLEALRSNWRQGKNWLCRQETDGICAYCCLGVLAKLEKRPETPRKNAPFTTRFDDNAAGLTEAIRQYDVLNDYGELPTGVEVNYTYIDGYKTQLKTLSELNDAGFSFIEIADILEACFTHID